MKKFNLLLLALLTFNLALTAGGGMSKSAKAALAGAACGTLAGSGSITAAVSCPSSGLLACACIAICACDRYCSSNTTQILGSQMAAAERSISNTPHTVNAFSVEDNLQTKKMD